MTDSELNWCAKNFERFPNKVRNTTKVLPYYITVHGRKKLTIKVIGRSSKWEDWNTGKPCKMLFLDTVAYRLVEVVDEVTGEPCEEKLLHKIEARWAIPIKGDNLTEHWWLEASDIVELSTGRVIFNNGFEIKSESGGNCVAMYTLIDSTYAPILTPESGIKRS
jgi:hypothetical protein